MKIVVQRSKKSSVSVDGKLVGKINFGLVVLVSFTHGDDEMIVSKFVKKLVNLRIFNDESHIMNKSILDVGGEVLSVSQFTLYGDCKKGNRPSYINALKGDEAIILYNYFNDEILKYNISLSTGIFGSDMEVNIINDGPVTIILESE